MARIDKWYDDNRILGAVMKGNSPFDDLAFQSGEFVFQVSEVKLGGISLKYVNGEGVPVKGLTKPKIVMREVRTQPGQIFDRNKLMQVRRIYVSFRAASGLSTLWSPAPFAFSCFMESTSI